MGTPGKPILDTSRMSSAQQRRRNRERMGVDPKCEELARHFLSDFDNKPEDITELAEIIQSRVEGFIADVFGESA